MRTLLMRAARIFAGSSLTCAIVLAPGPPALAKAPVDARIDGPGIVTPIVVRQAAGKEVWAEDDPVRLLAEHTGLWDVLANGESLDPGRPAGDLGPAYTVTFPYWAKIVVYPYAESGPWTHLRPANSSPQKPGWRRADPAIVPLLHDLGVPTRDGLARPTPTAAAPGNPGGEADTGAIVPIAGVATLIILALLGAAWRRGRRHTQGNPAGNPVCRTSPSDSYPAHTPLL